MNEELLEKLLQLLERQKFATWHEGRFADYISGELAAPEREEIKADLKRMLE